MSAPQTSLVYVTFPSEAQALEISRHLLAENLVACANLQGQGRSLYAWDGELRDESEWVVVYKTQPARVAALQGRIVELHPYETPCVLSWQTDASFEAFSAWVHAMTALVE